MDDQPQPPARPLWDGVYDFAWRPANLKAFITCSICLTLLSLFACGFYALKLYVEGLPQEFEKTGYFIIGIRAGAHVFACLAVLSFLSSIYPSACFMRILESTGAGDDRMQWNQGVWFDFLKDLLFLLWVSLCSAAIPGLFLAVIGLRTQLHWVAWWIVLFGGTLTLFPIFLLSTLMANLPWALIHVRILRRLLEEPLATAVIYLNTLAFAIPSILLGYWMITGFHLLMAPIVGIVWATYWLSYARVLGRAGWVLTEEKKKPRRMKRRKTLAREAKHSPLRSDQSGLS